MILDSFIRRHCNHRSTHISKHYLLAFDYLGTGQRSDKRMAQRCIAPRGAFSLNTLFIEVGSQGRMRSSPPGNLRQNVYTTECMYCCWVSLENGKTTSKTGTVICPVAEAQALLKLIKRGNCQDPKTWAYSTLSEGREFEFILLVQSCRQVT